MKDIDEIKNKLYAHVGMMEIGSMMFPEKKDDGYVYKIFIHDRIENDNGHSITEVNKIIECTEDEELTVTSINEVVYPIIRVKDKELYTFEETLDINDSYHESFSRMMEFVYKDNLTDEEKMVVSKFMDNLKLLIADEEKVLYEKYFPNFMKWLNEVI